MQVGALTAGAVENTKVAIEVSTPETTHQLAYSISHLDGDYDETMLVTVTHKFRVLNAGGSPVFVRSANAATSAEACELRPNQFTPLSPAVSGKITKGNDYCHVFFRSLDLLIYLVFFKSSSSEWSIGSLDLNQIGSYDILLPVASQEPEVLHVEVSLAPHTDLSCYISVAVWRIDLRDVATAPLRLKNTCDSPISVIQAGQKFAATAKLSQSVGASGEIPLGWIDPTADHHVEILLDSQYRPARNVIVDMTDVGVTQTLTLVAGQTMVLSLINYKYGKILEIRDGASNNRAVSPVQALDSMSFTIGLKKMSVSFIAERPIRREVLAMQLQNLSFNYSLKGKSATYVVKLQDVQIDNYFEFNEYPVLLSDDRREESLNMPLLEAFIEAETVSDQTVFRSLLARLLEVKLYVDASSVQLFIVDFYLHILPEWTDIGSTKVTDCKEYRETIMKHELLAEEVLTKVRLKEKVYIENLVIHPLKVSVSFTSTRVPRKFEGGVLDTQLVNLIRSVGVISTFSDVPIRISSFIACNVLESPDDLTSIIVMKFTRDVQGQLLHLIGSVFRRLDVIG